MLTVIAAKLVKGENFKIELHFSDGTSGVVDFKPFLCSRKTQGTVFEPLKQLEVFKRFKLDDRGTLAWGKDGGIDLSPDTLYSMMTKSYKAKVSAVYEVVAMPKLTLEKISGSNVTIYDFDDKKHKEPHFHVHTPDGVASVRIRDFSILESSGSQTKVDRTVRKVNEWARKHVNELSDAWNAAVVGDRAFKIQPAVAVVDGFEVRVYPGDGKQRRHPFVRMWKDGKQFIIHLAKIGPLAGLPPTVIDWIRLHRNELYERWGQALLDAKMAKIRDS